MENKSTEMRCKFCGYQWITASKMIMVSCPSCMKKNNNLNKGGIKDGETNKLVDVEIEKSNSRSNPEISNNLKPKGELNPGTSVPGDASNS